MNEMPNPWVTVLESAFDPSQCEENVYFLLDDYHVLKENKTATIKEFFCLFLR